MTLETIKRRKTKEGGDASLTGAGRREIGTKSVNNMGNEGWNKGFQIKWAVVTIWKYMVFFVSVTRM